MDLQELVNCSSVPSSILSVEKTPDGLCGEIRIVCANQPYRDVMGPGYYDGMIYHELVPKDVKFEDFCFRAAHMNQRLHAYVETKALDCWTDQTLIPLQPQGPKIGYCQFFFEFTKTAEPDRMASVSMDTAAAVIKANITLLRGDDFKASLKEVLTDILEMSNAYACRIMLVDHEKQEAVNFCEKIRGDAVPRPEVGDGTISYDVVASWESMIGVSNAVIVKDEREMEALEQRNPKWAKTLHQYRVTSLVLIPLRREKAIIGYLYVVNFDVEKTVEIKELLELMSVFLGSEISSYLLMRRLEALSTVDELTGMQNRRAMIARMESMSEVSSQTSFGIVNIDVNGLKVTNDESGHDAGDRLIMHAADILSGVFRKDDLYRAGGDEFIIIVTGMPRELFDERVGRLRAHVQEEAGVSLAIGSFWSDGDVDARAAFQRADQNMYIDKQAYYDKHPELRR